MKKNALLSTILAASLIFGLTACSGGKSEQTDPPVNDTQSNTGTVAKTEDITPEEESAYGIYAPDIPEIEGSDVEATLRVCTYYGGDSTTFAEFAAEQIKKKYPNVTLEFETLPQDGGQTIKTRAATGDLPEILLLDSGTIETLAESGSIYTLDEYVNKFSIKNYYTDAIMENCLYSQDGNIYQFPMGSISPILWYYNKTLFEEYNVKVPENFDELLEAVVVFRENDIIPLAMFGKEPWPLGAFFDSFAVKENSGGCYALSKGEAKASDEDYQKAIGKMEQLIEAGIFQDGVTNTDFDTASALFKDGRCAMFMNGCWYTADALEGLGDDVDFMVFYPTADEGNVEHNQYAMTGGGDTSGMGVTKSAEDVDLAASIAFLFSYYREVAQYEMKSLVTTPLQTDNLILEADELDHISQKLLDAIDNYTYNTRFLNTFPNTKFSTGFTEEMQKFLVGESREDFTVNVDKLIDKTVQ